jgi:pyruvate/2-oxoglutarate/acetoin dehydrogenase E1 component
MLWTALEDPDPVLIFENALLYNMEGELPEAADEDGISVEVIDLRVLRPLDETAILASLRKTRRAVVVDEGWRSGSLAAEVSARIMEGSFWNLDAPIGRVCSQEVPIPYPWHLEQAAIPQTASVVAAVKSIMGRA